MKRKKIDERLESVYKCIENNVLQFGYPPTVREIMSKIGVNSTATISYYLDKLEKLGKIKRGVGKNRSIELVSSNLANKTKKVALLGNVAAGQPIFAFSNYDEVYDLPVELFNLPSVNCFMLTINGDSMIKAGIYDKDKVIVRKQNFADNGEIVVAMIDNSATVKRYYNNGTNIRLMPENDNYAPIISNEVVILGKVVGLIRKY
jgi:repressor LexA